MSRANTDTQIKLMGQLFEMLTEAAAKGRSDSLLVDLVDPKTGREVTVKVSMSRWTDPNQEEFALLIPKGDVQ